MEDATTVTGPWSYSPDLARPRVLAFDIKGLRWLPASEPVPGHGKEFGILGGGFVYQGRMFCAMSTYKGYLPPGGPLGLDGKPHHFLDRWLCYDPESKEFGHLVCRGRENEYWLTCYAIVSGKHLYLTAYNAMNPDGSIGGALGEAVVFQTHPQGRPNVDPEFEEVPVLPGT